MAPPWVETMPASRFITSPLARPTSKTAIDLGIGDRLGHGRGRDRRGVEPEAALAIAQADHALVPAIVHAHELADRQGVEELVGDDQQRAVADLLEAVDPFGIIGFEPRILLGDQRRIGLEQPQVERVAKAFGAAGDAQHVGHQRAAAGAEFEQGEGLGAAHLLPEIDEEEADQLAEHLADFGRGDEVAGRAQRIGRSCNSPWSDG